MGVDFVMSKGEKCSFSFSATKFQLASVNDSDNSCGIILKVDGSFLKKAMFKMLGLSFCSWLNLGICFVSIAKLIYLEV